MEKTNRYAKFAKARRWLLALMLAAMAAALVFPVSFLSHEAWARSGGQSDSTVEAGVLSVSEFEAGVVSAEWRNKKTLDITFDQPVFVADDHDVIVLNTILDSAAPLGSDDVVSVSGCVVTITFSLYSSSNMYGVTFGVGSLRDANGNQNMASVATPELEGPFKIITKLTYAPMSLPATGGEVIATLEGENLHEDGWPKAMLYQGDTLVRELDNNRDYNEHAHTFAFTLPPNTGTAPRAYKLKFQKSNFSSIPAKVLEGADDVVTVAPAVVADEPEIAEITYSATQFNAQGGTVAVTLSGKALTQLTKDDFSITRNGEDSGVLVEYNAVEDQRGIAEFTLPQNASTTDDALYTLRITKGAEGIAGNPQTLVVKAAVTEPVVDSVDYIDRNLNPYHYGAGDYVLFYTAGTVKAVLTGENLDKLAPSDFALEEKGDDGSFSAIDGQVALNEVSATRAQVSFFIPENTSILVTKVYRFTVARAPESLANKSQEFEVGRPEESLGTTKFRIASPKWGASLERPGVVRIWVSEPQVELNPGFADGSLDVRDYIFFSNQNDEPFDSVRELAEDDRVYMKDGDIYIELADKEADLPFYVLFKGESLVSGNLVLATRDEYTHLHHNRYINQGPHIESIEYDQITYTSEGGHVHAVMRGTQLAQSMPALWGKVFVDSQKDYSQSIVPTIVLSDSGLMATVDFDVPANTTGRTISYCFIPVLNNVNVAPTYTAGYDVVSVLPPGGTVDDVTVSSVEVQGDGDLDDRLDVLSTSTSSEKFTDKIYLTLRGTNLSARKTAVKAVDENGVTWPTIPVFECGATIRWQSSSAYMPDKESINEQIIELLPPRRLGVPHTFTLFVAPDGKNYLDEPTATVILDNQGLFDYEDMVNRGFDENDLTQLIQVKVKYVDETGKEIAASDVLQGYGITEMYHQPIKAKDIEGYELKRTVPNNLDIMMTQPVVHSTGEYIFENGQYFFRDLKNTVSATGSYEPYTISFVYAKPTAPIDKSELLASIKAARDVSAGVRTSTNGMDVSTKEYWVPVAVKTMLDDSLSYAQSVIDDASASQAQVDAAKRRLDTVRGSFERAKRPGAKPATVAIASVSAADVVYSGAAKLPVPKLTVKGKDGKVLKAGTDFTASYAYNKGHGNGKGVAGQGYVGKATVKVVGKGTYTGTKSASFKVTTAADTKKAGAKITEKTLAGIDKYKPAEKVVAQANSKTMETIAVPKKKTMTVRWKAVKGATDYIVGYKRSTTKDWSYEMSGGKLEHTFANMKEGDLMEFRVAVYDGKRFARGEWTQVNCRFYREMVSLKATAGKARVDLKWGKVAGATGYQVLVATKKDMSDAVAVDVKGGSTVKYALTKMGKSALKPGKTYYLKMRAFKEAENINGKQNKYIGIQSLARTCKVK